MAKRKRLSPAALVGEDAVGTSAAAPIAPPIAQVAGTAAAEAALNALTDEMRSARAEGRLVQSLPLDAIAVDHLSRDRMVSVSEDMAALKASIAARGQQMPIEVIEQPGGRYGLISGWRRVQALRDLLEETGEPRFATVQAMLRQPESVAAAYRAMVEENELRVDLSFYERGQVAVAAGQADVFEGTQAAIAGLYPTASKSKRSKIASFVRIHQVLGDGVFFGGGAAQGETTPEPDTGKVVFQSRYVK